MTPASPDDAPAPPLTAIQLLSADDVCELWQVKKSWLYDAVESGILPAIKLGNHLRFRASDLAACLSDLATASPAGRSSRRAEDGSTVRPREPEAMMRSAFPLTGSSRHDDQTEAIR